MEGETKPFIRPIQGKCIQPTHRKSSEEPQAPAESAVVGKSRATSGTARALRPLTSVRISRDDILELEEEREEQKGTD